MNNGDKVAMPTPSMDFYRAMSGDIAREFSDRFGGLSKREYFAGLAMQGLLAKSKLDWPFNMLARQSVEAADALLKALENNND